MYSSEDLERFYFQYQTESLPNGESLQSFCKRNKVPYNIFQKWYKNTRTKIVGVKVDGMPGDQSSSSATSSPQTVSDNNKEKDVRIRFELRLSNGLFCLKRILAIVSWSV